VQALVESPMMDNPIGRTQQDALSSASNRALTINMRLGPVEVTMLRSQPALPTFTATTPHNQTNQMSQTLF